MNSRQEPACSWGFGPQTSPGSKEDSRFPFKPDFVPIFLSPCVAPLGRAAEPIYSRWACQACPTGGTRVPAANTSAVLLRAIALDVLVWGALEGDVGWRGWKLTLPLSPQYKADTLKSVQSGQGLQEQHPWVDYTSPAFITLLFTDLGVLTPSAVSDELIKLYL